ncbi:MAG: CDP-diacylglycerol--serine O-phosphatidyltransferase [Planctomycetota bacterium]
MSRVGVLPALVTMANGYCGLLAIYKTADGQFYTASWLIMLAMFFDMIDGRIARMAGATTRFGAFLDSLSDIISFGVAPAFLVKQIVAPIGFHPKALAFMTILFALGAMLRLARYNDEHASSEGLDKEEGAVSRFDGLPTPGAAGVIASLVFLAEDTDRLFDYQRLMVAMPFLCVVLGCLMVSRVPYVHVGQRFLRRRDFSYLFRVVVLVMAFSFFPHEGAAVGFVAYAIVGPILRPLRRTRQDDLDDEDIGPEPDGTKENEA